MSHAQIGRSLRAAVVRAMRVLSRDTTPANAQWSGSRILCPSFTHRAFRSIVIRASKIKWPLDFLKPGRGRDSEGMMSNATQRFVISLLSASRHRVLPFFSSRAYASFTLFGISTPYLWRRALERALTVEIIMPRLQRIYGAYQMKAGLLMSLRAAANSAVSIR